MVGGRPESSSAIMARQVSRQRRQARLRVKVPSSSMAKPSKPWSPSDHHRVVRLVAQELEGDEGIDPRRLDAAPASRPPPGGPTIDSSAARVARRRKGFRGEPLVEARAACRTARKKDPPSPGAPSASWASE